MKFVTKEEFENAVAILKLAINNGQVYYGHYDNPEEMVALAFFGHGQETHCDANYATFIGPKRAALKKLHDLRKSIEVQRKAIDLSHRDLEKLQKTEQELSQLIATLKE